MKLKFGQKMTPSQWRKMLLDTNDKPECWIFPRYSKAAAKRELAALNRSRQDPFGWSVTEGGLPVPQNSFTYPRHTLYSQAMLKRTTVWLDTAELKRLAKIAKEMDRPVAWLIRKAVSEYLQRAKEK